MGEELQPGDPRRIGPYRLIRQLGSGGMGRVFLGRSVGGRPVAVKVIRAELAADPEFRMRFRREVAAAQKVNGLYTALVVDADMDGPVPWLATAYVAGPSLADAVASHGPLPAASVLVLAAGLAEGLAAIHKVGLVHRDLKPSNVLLADDGPRVIDFGISRAAEASVLTHAGLVIGSPGFMSPEQAEGGEVGPPSDIFSLGAVLTFAATGHGPFGTGTTAALIYRVVHAPPSLDGVSAEIQPLIQRCLAKDPRQRPSTADLLAELGDRDPEEGWLPTSITDWSPRQAPDANAPAQHPATTTGAGYQHAEPTGPADITDRSQPDQPAWEAPAAPATGGASAATRTRSRQPRSRAGLAAAAAVLVVGGGLAAALVLSSSGGGGGAGQLSGPATGSRIAALANPKFAPEDAAFSPAANILAVGTLNSDDTNGGTYLWNVATHKLIATLTDPKGTGVFSVAFGAGGTTLAVGDNDGSTYLWDVASRKLIATLTDPNSAGVFSVAFGAGGTTLAAGDNNDSTYLWDVASRKLIATLTGPGSSAVNLVAFSPGGTTLAAGDQAGSTYLWDVATHKRIATLTDPGQSPDVLAVAFGPGGTTLATGDENGSTYLWDVATHKRIATLTDPGLSPEVLTAAFAPGGTTLAVGDNDGSTYLWYIPTRKITATLTDPHSSGVYTVAFGPGITLAAGDDNGSTYLWHIKSRS